MSRMSIQAAVTMGQLQKRLDVIGHNVANTNTAGYKSRQADFSSLLIQQIDNLRDPANEEGRVTPDGIRIGSGAKLAHTNIDLSIGALQQTDRPLDVALTEKNHLFQVSVTENGVTETQYTRSGNFYLNPMDDGTVMLTTADGHPLIGEDGPIRIVEGFESISLAEDGRLLVRRNGVDEAEGQLAFVEAIRPRMLEAVGDNNFRLSQEALDQFDENEILQDLGPGIGNVKVGSLENANVDLTKQMSDLVLTQRAYQLNARTISMNDQMSGLINQLR
ncbi:flagellar hook-basal body protein [Aquibacillus koreensis]|uniref:Flagellar hook-basal body protein n=1 Tax=Aquibacillus koreensis TaxID=279446 RepID=A0A9X3WK28_9BACI|nr:flagellar hook-basal body protein [Aquibacillus koreensis]MCT2535108.1 flagellar hook-basal body protein [Aquibacillus koreensis]MDC3419751.1 flagellar hook-basal body protein [Aquibacillus koreensis]